MGGRVVALNHGVMTLLKRMAGIGLLLMLPMNAHAQSEGWVLSPGSKAGKQSTVVPKNCVTGADGSITCDTEIVNPAGNTPARPYYNPFND